VILLGLLFYIFACSAIHFGHHKNWCISFSHKIVALFSKWSLKEFISRAFLICKNSLKSTKALQNLDLCLTISYIPCHVMS
jgi:hypothetical protein